MNSTLCVDITSSVLALDPRYVSRHKVGQSLVTTAITGLSYVPSWDEKSDFCPCVPNVGIPSQVNHSHFLLLPLVKSERLASKLRKGMDLNFVEPLIGFVR